MTGLDVALTIPRDWFVVDQIDNVLTASALDFPAGNTRTFFRAQGSAELNKE
jgi:hypothetical protein